LEEWVAGGNWVGRIGRCTMELHVNVQSVFAHHCEPEEDDVGRGKDRFLRCTS